MLSKGMSKDMKKILAIALAMVVVLGSMVFVSAAADATVTVATITQNVKAGDTVRIPVNISAYYDAYATIVIGSPTYDSSKLDFVGYEESEKDFTGSAVIKTAGEDFGIITIPSTSAEAIALSGGEICLLVFTAKTNLTEDTAISIEVKELRGYTRTASDTTWVNFKDLTSEVVEGAILPAASADATITVATVKGPFAAGDEVAIPVTITEWANAYATIELEFAYDSSLLTLDAVEPSDSGFSGAMAATSGKKFSLICNPSTPKQADKLKGGEICVAYFYAAVDNLQEATVTVSAAVKGHTNGEADEWIARHDLLTNVIAGGVGEGGVDVCSHAGGTATCIAKAVCTLCGEEYGEVNANNHVNTETRNGTEIWCKDCNTKISGGEPIEGDAVVTVGTLNGPFAAGDEIAIPVTITEWANAYGSIELVFSYDEALLDLDSIEISETGFKGASGSGNGKKFNLIAAPTSASAAQKLTGGEICVAYFYAATDITSSTEVTVSAKVKGYTNGEADNWVEFHELDTAVVPGGVKVGGGVIDPPSQDINAVVGTLNQNFAQGEEVRIPIVIGKYENGYGAIDVKDLVYDNTALEFVEIVESATDFQINGKMAVSNGEKYSLILAPSSTADREKIKEGEICVLVFKAKKEITFSTSVTATVVANGYTTATGIDVASVPVTVKAGGVNGHVHVADPDAEIKYDENNHWYECKVGCGNLVDVAPHEGGEATCIAKAKCSVCGAEYGNINADNHKNTETVNAVPADCGNDGYTGDTFCNDCQKVIATGETIPATGAHAGGEATCCAKAECSVCGQEYGDFNNSIHDGGTEVRDYVAADCGNDGYTGDTYCLGCNTKIADGAVIPATGAHVGGEATCCAKAVCDVCGKEYGELNADNHKDTKVINAKDADCGNDGYTGDIFCNDCQTVVEDGQVIPATGAHVGGEATCISKAVCTVCNKEYGNVNANNHKHTEIRNESATYTGDIWCTDCGAFIQAGEQIGIIGDADNDGEVTIIDAMIISQYDVGFDVTINLELADVDGDGEVTIIDAMLISQFDVGLIEKFPVEQ